MFESFSAFGFLVQTPCGPRKSGIPDSVEMPAPVSTTTCVASSIHWRASMTAAFSCRMGTARSYQQQGTRALSEGLRPSELPYTVACGSNVTFRYSRKGVECLSYCFDHHLWLIERNPVTAVRRYDVASARRERSQRVLLSQAVITGIGRRDCGERQIAETTSRRFQHLCRADANRLDLAAERLEELRVRPEL